VHAHRPQRVRQGRRADQLKGGIDAPSTSQATSVSTGITWSSGTDVYSA